MTKPIILNVNEFDQVALDSLRTDNKIWSTVDIYESQLKELYEINHPGANVEGYQAFADGYGSGDLAGAWIYYPWSGVLLHCVGADDLFLLRTNRNQNLITADEQRRLAGSTVAVAGMSVGSGIAMACVTSGAANTIKIADFDTLETANLNRLSQSLTNIGQPKVDLTAQKIYELNPFADIQAFNGVTTDNIDQFFHSPDAAVIIDEIDDFKMKVQLRLKAKKDGVPLLMFTSIGDNILVDVERYDLDPALPIFNGAIGDVPEEILANPGISPEDIRRYAVTLVGPQYVPTKAMGSLLEIGRTLVGRPQLYSTIAVDGGLAAYLVRCIILGSPLESGRYFVKFAALFNMPSNDLAETPERQAILQQLMGPKN